jgi:hypothetical protein
MNDEYRISNKEQRISNYLLNQACDNGNIENEVDSIDIRFKIE